MEMHFVERQSCRNNDSRTSSRNIKSLNYLADSGFRISGPAAKIVSFTEKNATFISPVLERGDLDDSMRIEVFFNEIFKINTERHSISYGPRRNNFDSFDSVLFVNLNPAHQVYVIYPTGSTRHSMQEAFEKKGYIHDVSDIFPFDYSTYNSIVRACQSSIAEIR